MKLSQLKKVGLLFAFSISLSSCLSGSDYDQQSNPNISFALVGNMSPDAPNLNFFLDNQRITSTAKAYGQVDGYYTVYAGSHTIFAKNAVTGETLASRVIEIPLNQQYSIFATDSVGSLDISLFNDQFAIPAEGMTRVRFINLSPDSDPVTIRESGNNVVSNLAYGQASSYLEVPGGGYIYQVMDANQQVLFVTDNQMLEVGQVNTILIKGFTNPDEGQPSLDEQKYRNF